MASRSSAAASRGLTDRDECCRGTRHFCATVDAENEKLVTRSTYRGSQTEPLDCKKSLKCRVPWRSRLPLVTMAEIGAFRISKRYPRLSTLRLRGVCGLNFHDPRGTLVRAYPYSELRDDARAMGARLAHIGVAPGDRIALIAETGPEFAAPFLRMYVDRRVAGAASSAHVIRRARFICRTARRADAQRSATLADASARTRWPVQRCGDERRHARDRLAELCRTAGRPPSPSIAPQQTISPICNIRADRPAFRTASRSLTGHFSTISLRIRTAWSLSLAIDAFRGCRGIMTWGLSDVSCRPWPIRFQQIT